MSKGVQNNGFWLEGGALRSGIRTSILGLNPSSRNDLGRKSKTTNCFFFFHLQESRCPAITQQRAPPRRSRTPGTKGSIWTVSRRSNGQILKTLASEPHCSYLQETLTGTIQYRRDLYYILHSHFFYPRNEGEMNYCLRGHQDGQVGIFYLQGYYCMSFRSSCTTGASLWSCLSD